MFPSVWPCLSGLSMEEIVNGYLLNKCHDFEDHGQKDSRREVLSVAALSFCPTQERNGRRRRQGDPILYWTCHIFRQLGGFILYMFNLHSANVICFPYFKTQIIRHTLVQGHILEEVKLELTQDCWVLSIRLSVWDILNKTHLQFSKIFFFFIDYLPFI